MHPAVQITGIICCTIIAVCLFQLYLDSQKSPRLLILDWTSISRYVLPCRAPLAYDIELDAMIYNPKLSLEGYDLDYSFAHELSHRIYVV